MQCFKQIHGEGKGLALTAVEEVVTGAAFGRVDTVFEDIESRRWGVL